MTNIKNFFDFFKTAKKFVWGERLPAVVFTAAFLFYLLLSVGLQGTESPLEFPIEIMCLRALSAALIPLISYKIAEKLEIKQKWIRLLAALTAGGFSAVIVAVRSGGGAEFLFPCLMSLLLLNIVDLSRNSTNNPPKSPTRSLATKRFFSVLLSLTSVAAFFLDSRMTAPVFAIILTVILSKIFDKSGLIPFLTFTISFAVFFAIFYLLILKFQPFLSSQLELVYIKNFLDISEFNTKILSAAPIDVLKILSGRLFYFTVSTWGLGILGLCFFVKTLRGTDSGNQAGNPKLMTFSTFAYLSLIIGITAGVLQGFKEFSGFSESFEAKIRESQDFLISGNYTNGIIPLVLISVVYWISTQKVELRDFLNTIIIQGVIFISFFAISAETVISAKKVDISSITAIYPLIIGKVDFSPVTQEGFFMTVSAVYCLMALFIVFISCGGRYKFQIISAAMAAIALYSCVFTCLIRSPEAEQKIEIETAEKIEEVSEIYEN